MKVIVVASAKGGVAKTTTAVTLASALGQHQSTLLIDFDPQGQCALWFGLDPRSGVYDWVAMRRTLDNVTVAAAAGQYLWLLPGDSKTKAVEKLYHNLQAQQYLELVADIRNLREHFEYVVIDTAPTGILQEVAMGAADEIVVPFRCEAPGTDGAYGTLAMLDAMIHEARITLLPVDFYQAVIEQQRNLADFTAAQPGGMVAAPVPHRIAVAEAVAEGKTIWEYTGRGIKDVQRAYRDLLDRLLEGAAVPWLHASDEEKNVSAFPTA